MGLYYLLSSLSSLTILSHAHNDVLRQVGLFEKAALECFQNKVKLSKKDYLEMVSPCRTLFKIGLVAHFKHEEIALFPVLMLKSETAAQTTRNLFSEHKIMMDKFNEFEDIEDYDLSIQKLNEVMKDLAIHAKKEEDFFSSIQLTKDEATRIDEISVKFGLK